MSAIKILQVRAIGADPALSQRVADENTDWTKIRLRLEILDNGMERIIRVSNGEEIASGKDIVAYTNSIAYSENNIGYIDNEDISKENRKLRFSRTESPNTYSIYEIWNTTHSGFSQPSLVKDQNGKRILAGSKNTAIEHMGQFLDNEGPTKGRKYFISSSQIVEVDDATPLCRHHWLVSTGNKKHILNIVNGSYPSDIRTGRPYEVVLKEGQTIQTGGDSCYFINKIKDNEKSLTRIIVIKPRRHFGGICAVEEFTHKTVASIYSIQQNPDHYNVIDVGVEYEDGTRKIMQICDYFDKDPAEITGF